MVNAASTASQVLPTGDLYHTGYVVSDIRSSIRHWVEQVGVGPFVLFENFEFVDPVYRGVPGGPRVTLAFGAHGEGCIELIQPLDPAPSIYSELPGALHHLGVGVPDLAVALARYRAAGVTCPFHAAFPFGGGCAYLDTRGTLGCFTELVEIGPVVSGLLSQMRTAHAGWNRRDHLFELAG